jgi:hypothetical protein
LASFCQKKPDFLWYLLLNKAVLLIFDPENFHKYHGFWMKIESGDGGLWLADIQKQFLLF